MPRVAPGATPVQFCAEDSQEQCNSQQPWGEGSSTHQLFVICSKNARDMGTMPSSGYNSMVSVTFFLTPEVRRVKNKNKNNNENAHST